MDKAFTHIPNLLSLLRIALVPVLALAAAFKRNRFIFIGISYFIAK